MRRFIGGNGNIYGRIGRESGTIRDIRGVRARVGNPRYCRLLLSFVPVLVDKSERKHSIIIKDIIIIIIIIIENCDIWLVEGNGRYHFSNRQGWWGVDDGSYHRGFVNSVNDSCSRPCHSIIVCKIEGIVPITTKDIII